MIVLGAHYKDKVTGFVGVAMGLVTYLTGCNQVLLSPPVDKDGKFQSSLWFDEERMEPTDGVAVVVDKGPTPDPAEPGTGGAL